MEHVARVNLGRGGEGKGLCNISLHIWWMYLICCLSPLAHTNRRTLSTMRKKVTQTGPLHILTECICVDTTAYIK